MFLSQAKQVIYDAIVDEGILASAIVKDNYRRVWSRDSMMTGLVGFSIQDEKIINGFERSVLTLAKYQAENGQIPSNVALGNNPSVSYGSLVGRVDATTWWIIGCAVLLKHNKGFFEKYFSLLKQKIYKALDLLNSWEFNQKGLIYTPLGGNWADEYVCSGYTLYDNVLRYWALKAVNDVFEDDEIKKKRDETKSLIISNYSNQESGEKYHPTAFAAKLSHPIPFLSCSFSANGYDQRWDMAGNALALLMNLNEDVDQITQYLAQLHLEFNHWMLPVFHPIIFQNDKDWYLLNSNYLYDFKNQPYHFHNGGSWPIFLGWLCIALNKHNKKEVPLHIFQQYEQLLKTESKPNFYEYYSTNNLIHSGAKRLCFSAIGYIMMYNTFSNQLKTNIF